MRSVRWACGVTTVPKRLGTLLPATLRSIELAGFPSPRLFVDGAESPDPWRHFGAEVTVRWPRMTAYGNWILGLAELYIRDPLADFYAMFQDDVSLCLNLRKYLNSLILCQPSEYPAKGYWNLFTCPQNQRLAPRVGQTARRRVGWYPSNQKGLGALALVFDQAAVRDLITSERAAERPIDPVRGWRYIDGGVMWALAASGRSEYVHNPSLAQHTGFQSVLDKRRSSHGKEDSFPAYRWAADTLAPSWRGPDFDAMALLEEAKL